MEVWTAMTNPVHELVRICQEMGLMIFWYEKKVWEPAEFPNNTK
jgi:hypothetical protein